MRPETSNPLTTEDKMNNAKHIIDFSNRGDLLTQCIRGAMYSANADCTTRTAEHRAQACSAQRKLCSMHSEYRTALLTQDETRQVLLGLHDLVDSAPSRRAKKTEVAKLTRAINTFWAACR